VSRVVDLVVLCFVVTVVLLRFAVTLGVRDLAGSSSSSFASRRNDRFRDWRLLNFRDCCCSAKNAAREAGSVNKVGCLAEAVAVEEGLEVGRRLGEDFRSRPKQASGGVLVLRREDEHDVVLSVASHDICVVLRSAASLSSNTKYEKTHSKETVPLLLNLIVSQVHGK